MPVDQTLIDGVKTAINAKNIPQPTQRKVWVEACDRISFHAKGIRPQFAITKRESAIISHRPENTGHFTIITPANYDVKYQYLIDNYILNRHPNENVLHYNWRLSTFPLIAQEIYLNAKQQIVGAIFQNSHYQIGSLDESVQEYLEDVLNFDCWLKDELPEHVFCDPFGLCAVIESHFGEFTANEPATPQTLWVASSDIMFYVPGKEILFDYKPADMQPGAKKIKIYLNETVCIKYKEGDKDQFDMIAAYEHGIGKIPIIENKKWFFQPFVSWADLICRNVSDDEVIAKNASYPIREIVTPKCQNCFGTGKMPNPDPEKPGEITCNICHGDGVKSFNPGDTFYTPEQDENDARPQKDKVKFYNPSIDINKFSFDRWQKFRDFGMKSMHMQFVDDAQSGVAKAYDRDQLYLLISNVSNKLFEIGEMCIKFVTAYLTLADFNSIENYTVDKPQQFQIKSEYDIQKEYTELLTSNADLSVRRAKLDEYYAKIYYGNNVAQKKYSIIKSWDWLFAMSDNELNTRMLLKTAQTIDFIRHDRAENLINTVINNNGEEWFLDTDTNTIIAELEKLLLPLIPAANPTTEVIPVESIRVTG